MNKKPLPGEFELIARYLAPLATACPGAFGLADDAAVLDVSPDRRLVVTVDAMAAGTHFLRDDPADLVARKLLRVNLSDLAAMGAAPLAYLTTLALDGEADAAWLEAFTAGLAADQAQFGVALAGGDTIRTDGPTVLTITALGTVAGPSPLRRNGARPGDLVYVSGTIGDGALGLAALKGELDQLDDGARTQLAERYRLPQPRLALGQALVGVASAAIDVSDGLVADLTHICAASDVAAEIETARVPLSTAAQQALAGQPDLLERVLSGGDDYELLFTVPPDAEGEATEAAATAGVEIAAIGRVTASDPELDKVRVTGPDGDIIALESAGYEHF